LGAGSWELGAGIWELGVGVPFFVAVGVVGALGGSVRFAGSSDWGDGLVSVGVVGGLGWAFSGDSGFWIPDSGVLVGGWELGAGSWELVAGVPFFVAVGVVGALGGSVRFSGRSG